MELKYIVFEKSYGGGLKQRLPILFFEPLSHAAMYESAKNNEDLQGCELVSAGFITIDLNGKLQTHGKSTSLQNLKLPCRPLKGDAEMIACYNYLHGLI